MFGAQHPAMMQAQGNLLTKQLWNKASQHHLFHARNESYFWMSYLHSSPDPQMCWEGLDVGWERPFVHGPSGCDIRGSVSALLPKPIPEELSRILETEKFSVWGVISVCFTFKGKVSHCPSPPTADIFVFFSHQQFWKASTHSLHFPPIFTWEKAFSGFLFHY